MDENNTAPEQSAAETAANAAQEAAAAAAEVARIESERLAGEEAARIAAEAAHAQSMMDDLTNALQAMVSGLAALSDKMEAIELWTTNALTSQQMQTEQMERIQDELIMIQTLLTPSSQPDVSDTNETAIVQNAQSAETPEQQNQETMQDKAAERAAPAKRWI